MDKGLCATAAETFLVTFLTLLVQNMPCCVGVAYPNILIPVVRGQNMKNLYWVLPAAAILFVAMATGARAQSRPGGGVFHCSQFQHSATGRRWETRPHEH